MIVSGRERVGIIDLPVYAIAGRPSCTFNGIIDATADEYFWDHNIKGNNGLGGEILVVITQEAKLIFHHNGGNYL